MNEPCLATGIEHMWEWVTAAFGSQTFQCRICGLPQDVIEDSQT